MLKRQTSAHGSEKRFKGRFNIQFWHSHQKCQGPAAVSSLFKVDLLLLASAGVISVLKKKKERERERVNSGFVSCVLKWPHSCPRSCVGVERLALTCDTTQTKLLSASRVGRWAHAHVPPPPPGHTNMDTPSHVIVRKVIHTTTERGEKWIRMFLCLIKYWCYFSWNFPKMLRRRIPSQFCKHLSVIRGAYRTSLTDDRGWEPWLQLANTSCFRPQGSESLHQNRHFNSLRVHSFSRCSLRWETGGWLPAAWVLYREAWWGWEARGGVGGRGFLGCLEFWGLSGSI